jgi:hypothetical protein
MEAKLKELNALVVDLGKLHKVGPARSEQQILATKKSPNSRNWKNPLLIQDAYGGEGMLPTITEGKHYPRRTLEYVLCERDSRCC